LQPKVKDRRPKTIIESGGDPELIAAMDCPVRYVRVDPEFEWMGNIEQSVKQVGLESMMAQMLEKEKDVVAQTIAVEFLGRRVANGSVSAVLVLDKCLNSEDTFCRVRAEAALALGQSASEKTQWGGLNALIRYYKKFQCDADTGKPKQNDFRDLSKVIVDEAVITALSYVMNGEHTHPDALETIVARLKYNDNEGNPQSDDGFMATCIAALGRCVPASAKELQTITQMIHYYIQRDNRFPSDDLCVTCAGIRALGLLASTIDSKELRAAAERFAELGFALGKQSTVLASADTMMYLRYAETKNEIDALKYMLDRSAQESAATKAAMLWSVCEYLQAFAGADSLKGISKEMLSDLRDLVLKGGSEIASAAFSILTTLASHDEGLSEIRESIAAAIQRAGDQVPVGVDIHAVHDAPTAEDEARRAEKEAKRARKRERERARQAARAQVDLQHDEQRRKDAEVAFVEQQAEQVQDDKTTASERTATMVGSEGGDNTTPQGGTPVGGLKRARDQNPSVTQLAAEDPPAPAAPEGAAPKKLKLSFKIKKPAT
jgi:hypothetical protein